MDKMIYNPLEQFRDHIFPEYKKRLHDHFNSSVSDSAIGTEENRRLCNKIYALETLLSKLKSKLSYIKYLRVTILIIALIGVCTYPIERLLHIYIVPLHPRIYIIGLTTIGILLLILFFILRKPLNSCKNRIKAMEEDIAQKKQQAFQQVEPLLNRLSWQKVKEIIQQVVPLLSFDRFFSTDRYNELVNDFGTIDDMDSDNLSVTAIESGSIEGNPFVLMRRKHHYMGEKTYTGSKTISWTENERGSDGRMHRVTHTETLYAHVTKPYPEYYTDTVLVFGNDAAPNLTFTKSPNAINSETGFSARRKLRREIRRLERFSRKLTDESSFTIMTNKEFEARFNTSDRNNETEYRVLFTPLAQRQMLSLLTDHAVGYGDDFSFIKQRKINIIRPKHLSSIQMDMDNRTFHSFDIHVIKQKWMAESEEYFRSLYFTFAPLLAIPIYQQVKSERYIWGDFGLRKSASWEWEAIANRYGEDEFCNEECETESILKAEHIRDINKRESKICITAYGYSSEPNYDYVSVYGGDGRFHSVKVDWDEYQKVSNSRNIIIKELTDNEIPSKLSDADGTIYRNILSKLQ